MCERKGHRHRDQKDRHHLKNIEHLFFPARLGQLEQKKPAIDYPWRLKYWTARSCFSAAARVLKVPRFRRLPVLGSFLNKGDIRPRLVCESYYQHHPLGHTFPTTWCFIAAA